MSGGATSLHAPVPETTAVGPSARVRPMVTNGGGGKADDQSDVYDARPKMGIFHGRSAKYAACNMAGGGPKDERPSMTVGRRL